MDFAQKHQKAGWEAFGQLYSFFDIQPTIRRQTSKTIESMQRSQWTDTVWSRDVESSHYTLADLGKGNGARGRCPRHGICYQVWPTVEVGGWSNRPPNPQDNKVLGWALKKIASAAPHVEALSTAVTDRSAGVISTLRGAGATFLLPPNAGNLRRAAAELMHLTKHYLATGISAFTPETLW